MYFYVSYGATVLTIQITIKHVNTRISSLLFLLLLEQFVRGKRNHLRYLSSFSTLVQNILRGYRDESQSTSKNLCVLCVKFHKFYRTCTSSEIRHRARFKLMFRIANPPIVKVFNTANMLQYMSSFLSAVFHRLSAYVIQYTFRKRR